MKEGVRAGGGRLHPCRALPGEIDALESNGHTRYIVESIARDEHGVAVAWLAEFVEEELASCPA